MLHLDMGKYAVYVWPAYAISAAVLAALIWDSLARARRWRKAAEEGGAAEASGTESDGTP